MQKLILPVLVIFYLLVSSCKKEQEYGVFTFDPYLSQKADSISYDSAYFLIINYSMGEEFKNASEIIDSTTSYHTIKLSLEKNNWGKMSFTTADLNWKVGNYVIKKYDLVDKLDKVIYSIPYIIPEKYVIGPGNLENSSVVPLPLIISIGTDITSYSHSIIKN